LSSVFRTFFQKLLKTGFNRIIIAFIHRFVYAKSKQNKEILHIRSLRNFRTNAKQTIRISSVIFGKIIFHFLLTPPKIFLINTRKKIPFRFLISQKFLVL